MSLPIPGKAEALVWPARIAASFVMALLRGYKRYVSRWLPAACRFAPTCSEYACESVERYGLIKGGWMAVRRLFRCHPFHAGGFDPVP